MVVGCEGLMPGFFQLFGENFFFFFLKVVFHGGSMISVWK